MMIYHAIAEKHLVKKVKTLTTIVCALTFVLLVNPVSAAENRFKAPQFNSALDDFNKRFSSSNVNIEFIVAQVLNNARQIERAGEDFQNNASLYRNQGGGGANAGSVIVPPGTTADTIIIINQNDGDSYAIQR